MNEVINGILFYVIWVALHFASTHLYGHFCTPWTLHGFFLSPLMAPSPHCAALRWVINTGGDTINLMWFAIGTTTLRYMVRRR